MNRAHPRFGGWTADEARAAAVTAEKDGDADLAELWRSAAEIADVVDAETLVAAPLASRVGDAPIVEVPLLEDDVHDTVALERIRTVLFGGG